MYDFPIGSWIHHIKDLKILFAFQILEDNGQPCSLENLENQWTKSDKIKWCKNTKADVLFFYKWMSSVSYVLHMFVLFLPWEGTFLMQRISNMSSCSSSCLFLFTVETLSQSVPKNSCDFVRSPQLTMLHLKNSSLNKATLTRTHTQTPN